MGWAIESSLYSDGDAVRKKGFAFTPSSFLRLLFSLFVLVFFLYACGGGSDTGSSSARATPVITFEGGVSSVTKTSVDVPFTIQATATGTPNGPAPGVVTYTSSDPSLATVDAATGTVTLSGGDTTSGTVTIMASTPEDANYNAASASYAVVVMTPFPTLKLKSRTDSTLTLTNTDGGSAEQPPAVVRGETAPGQTRNIYFLSTSWTKQLTSSQSLADRSLTTFDFNGSTLGSEITTRPSNWNKGYLDPQTLPAAQDWKRTYYGLFTAIRYTHATLGDAVFFTIHGENKNLYQGGYLYQNTIWPSYKAILSDPSTYSGKPPGGTTFNESWPAYFATVNFGWQRFDAAHAWGGVEVNDVGPIAWPANGYADNVLNKKLSSGLRHPSGILASDGYFYVYYQDASSFGDYGDALKSPKVGIKVVRSPKDSVTDPKSWQVYTIDGTWQPSLPTGFTKEKMSEFVSIPGQKSKSLFGLNKSVSNATQFSVARVAGTSAYLGLLTYYKKNDSGVPTIYSTLHTSRDMVNWSESLLTVQELPSATAGFYDHAKLMSADGGSDTVVDANDFIVIGSESSKLMHRVHLSLDIGQ